MTDTSKGSPERAADAARSPRSVTGRSDAAPMSTPGESTLQASDPVHDAVLVPRRGRGRTLGAVAVLVVALGAVAFTWWLSQGNDQLDTAGPSEPLNTDTIRVRDLTESTTIDGVLAFEDAQLVSASGPGVVVSVPDEGTVLERGSLLYVVDEEASDEAILAAQQRVTAARASVAGAQVQYESVTESPGAGDIATAEASVAQAQTALEDLLEPASEAELAAARAALYRAEEAYSALFDGPDRVVVDNAEAAVRQAEQRLAADQQARDLAEIDLEAAQTDYCALDPLPVAGLCGAGDIPLSDSEVDALIDAIADATTAGDPATAATMEAFVNANTVYLNADAAVEASQASLDTAELNLSELTEPPTQAQTEAALADVLAAEDRLQALVDGPTDVQIQQAEANLAAAEGRLADLRAGASSSQRSQAGLNLENARLSLQSALNDLAALDGDPETALLLYGATAAWRSLSIESEPGLDVEQLETNLAALGYDAEGALVVDDTYDEATAAAVAALQADFGLEPSGEVDLGWVVFVPGPAQVSSLSVEVGDAVVPAMPLFELTAVELVTSSVSVAGVSDSAVTAQRVTTQLDLVDRDILDIGTEVAIELPDDTQVMGEVVSIGAVPVIVAATPQQAASSYVDVVIALAESVDPIWTGATVDVDVVTEIAAGVLSTPVSALLALQEGGYAVEVVNDDGTTTLIGVETGMFADGFVELIGEGIEEGMTVVVP